MSTTYAVPAQNFSTLQAQLDRLSKRATKLGLPPVTLVEVGRRAVTKVIGHNALLEPIKRTTNYVDVQIVGTSPKIAGWTLSAVLDFTYDGVILREVPGETVPEIYRTADGTCEHCKSARRRKNVFVLRHVETGELKQVGRQCIADFLGHPDAEKFAQMAECLRSFEASCQDACQDAEDGRSYGNPVFGVYVPTYLEYVACAIRLDGWKSTSQHGYNVGSSTASSALDFMYPPKGTNNKSKFKVPVPSADDVKLAAEALTWVRETLPAKGQRLSNFEHNLVTLAKSDNIAKKHIGYVASIVRCYTKTLEIAVAAHEDARQRTNASPGVQPTSARQEPARA